MPPRECTQVHAVLRAHFIASDAVYLLVLKQAFDLVHQNGQLKKSTYLQRRGWGDFASLRPQAYAFRAT